MIAVLLLCAALVLLGVHQLWREGGVARERTRALRELEESPIGSARGVVHVSGRLRVVGSAIDAPVRQRPVAYACVQVEGSMMALSHAHFAPLATVELWAEVSLEDRSGAIALEWRDVHPEFDAIRHDPHEFMTGVRGDPPSGLAAIIREHQLHEAKDPSGILWPHLHAREWALEDGDQLAVLGEVVEPDGPYRSRRSLIPRRIIVRSTR